ncbi:hypothetical protein IWQ47_004628 [Aquimarina sp. EL_43]|uniref:Membrane protein n=1 Tax=Aquimarina atlantica TaxID=1317122 RepID=A0A023BPC4_9FLAO|nr:MULTISPECIES: hypothetical protein [Aquimarina]EZH71907.1 membrane protein [Aquimarina atlantica]MBG6133220.1 hypothetical protein [Aquimarina sp. EL_35]MBG6153421.1 hypothetical protein [Aquimarina sp. EL_32]MBG6171534.1 hypothetical protein [Aquimarina sp. EL_43]
MSEFEEYLVAIAICSPLFFFIIAVAFRLLDNSASIFLKHDILVDTSYVSGDIIREHIHSSEDLKLKKSLKKALLFRKLHNFFMILMVISIPPVIIACFFVF